jgi:hypothetical protein
MRRALVTVVLAGVATIVDLLARVSRAPGRVVMRPREG